jgi:hypothetical protein
MQISVFALNEQLVSVEVRGFVALVTQTAGT